MLFKKLRVKAIAIIVMVLLAGSILINRIIFEIHRPYGLKALDDFHKKPDQDKVNKIIKYYFILSLTPALAFHIIFLILIVYLLFSKNKYWKELWFSYLAISLTFILFNIMYHYFTKVI